MIACYLRHEKRPYNGLPDDQDVVFLNHRGKELLRAHTKGSVELKCGLAVFTTKKDGQLSRCEIVDKHGRTTEPFEAERLAIVSRNRILKQAPDLDFDSKLWKENQSDRMQQFSNLLSNYNLIGMPRSGIEMLLGPPDYTSSTYNLFSPEYSCLLPRPTIAMQLEYDDHDSVKQWRGLQPVSPTEPDKIFTSNMEFVERYVLPFGYGRAAALQTDHVLPALQPKTQNRKTDFQKSRH